MSSATISVTLGELKLMESTLRDCMQIHLPVVISFKLAKIAKLVGNELRDLEENRKNLVKKFGTQDADGNISVSEENMQKFQEEFKSLLDLTVSLDCQKIKISEFGNEIELTPMILAVLDPFISE